MKLTRHKIRKLHKQKNQSLKRIKDGSKPKHHKKYNNNTFRQKNRVDDSDSNKNIARFRLSHLFNKTLKSYIPAKELARINKKYKENRYQRRIRKMIPDGKRTGIMTGGADEPRAAPLGWELLYDPQGRPFYGNPTLKITQYEYPELPPGWEVLYDPNGQPYYGNKTLNITQWEFPSPDTPGQQSPATPGQQSPATPGLSPATNTILPKKEEIKEVDARDSLGNWYKAYIIKHFKFDVVPELPEMLKVHFVGWGVGNDENIPVVKEAERIRPRTPDAKTGQLITTQKDDTIDGVIALYTENEMTRSKEKAEAEAREFKQDQPTGATAPPMEDEGGEDSEDSEGGEGGEDSEDGEKKKDEAAEVKPAGKCSDKIKTPYAQMINLQVKADDEGEISVTVDPVSTGIGGLPGILNRGQEPVTPAPADTPAGGQQPPVTPGNEPAGVQQQQPPAGGQQPPVISGTSTSGPSTPGPGNSATVGGARHTRRKKYAKRGNKRKMTITRK